MAFENDNFASEPRVDFESRSKEHTASTVVRYREGGTRAEKTAPLLPENFPSKRLGRSRTCWCYRPSRKSFHTARQLSSTDRSASASAAAILVFRCALGIACESLRVTPEHNGKEKTSVSINHHDNLDTQETIDRKKIAQDVRNEISTQHLSARTGKLKTKERTMRWRT